MNAYVTEGYKHSLIVEALPEPSSDLDTCVPSFAKVRASITDDSKTARVAHLLLPAPAGPIPQPKKAFSSHKQNGLSSFARSLPRR